MDAPVELAPLSEVDAVLQHAASHVNKLSLKLPVQYRFRMKDVRVKRAVPAAETATASSPLTLRCKLDVGECWMAYVPGNFAQPWGYRRALMVSRRAFPLSRARTRVLKPSTRLRAQTTKSND